MVNVPIQGFHEAITKETRIIIYEDTHKKKKERIT